MRSLRPVYVGFVFAVVCHAQIPPSQSTDWLVHPVLTATTLKKDGELIHLTNGLIERSFLIRDGAFCTVEYKHLRSLQTFFRSVSPEANLTLSGSPFDVGGCLGVGDEHHEFWTPDVYLPLLIADSKAFQFKSFTTTLPEKAFEWEPGRRHSPTDMAWPPKGLRLDVNFVPPAGAPQALTGFVVTVHYEMFDGLPALRKWVSVSMEAPLASKSVTVDSLVMELLRAPNWAPEMMTIVADQANNPAPFSQQVKPDPGISFPGRDQPFWFPDPGYDQGGDAEIHVPYTMYTFLAFGYSQSLTYGGSTGPGAVVEVGANFTSMPVIEILHDSADVDRQGLGIRRAQYLLTPQLLEQPIPFMIFDISSSARMRLAVDQAAAAGVELVIVGFGAAGWCGMCPGQTQNATFRAWFKGEVDYARSKGVDVSGYTLMQLNGWGEGVPPEERCLSRDGASRLATACFATEYHAAYRRQVLEFLEYTGMRGLETDGQFESIPCSDTSGDHHHNGIAGGWHYQLKATEDFNKALKALGLYQTGADAYSASGANKWNHADTDEFSHLPLWEMHTVGRMYIYDSTVSRLPSSGQIGLNDLSEASKSCGRPRLSCFDFVLGTQIMMGSIGSFGAPRLYDPADPEAPKLGATIAKWYGFYKHWRGPRPSGAADLMISTLVHVRRPDSRSMEVVLHATSDASAAHRGMASFVNPSSVRVASDVVLPLWHTGLAPGTAVRCTWAVSTDQAVTFTGPAQTYRLGEGMGAGFTDIVVPVMLEPSSYGILLIELPSDHVTFL